MKQLSLLLWLAFTNFSSSLVASKKTPLCSKAQLVVLYIISDQNNTDPKSAQLLQPNPRNIFKRDDNGGCGPAYSGLETRDVRTEILILIQRNASALDRRMELPDLEGRRPMPDFFHEEKPKWTPFVIRESSSKPKDLSASIIQDLTNLGTVKDKDGNDVPVTQFSTGKAELKGCTTLYIISHKGVFAAHYWESVSFDPDNVWLAASVKEWTPEAKAKMFKTTVLDPLKNGSKYHPKLNAKILEDEHIKAYLIVPNQTWREEGAGDTGYEDQWNEMKNMVASIIPTLVDDGRWTKIRYTPVKNKRDLRSRYKANGKNVFKYDSQHPVAGTGNTQHKAALWVEDQTTPYHDETW